MPKAYYFPIFSMMIEVSTDELQMILEWEESKAYTPPVESVEQLQARLETERNTMERQEILKAIYAIQNSVKDGKEQVPPF